MFKTDAVFIYFSLKNELVIINGGVYYTVYEILILLHFDHWTTAVLSFVNNTIIYRHGCI